MVREMAGSGLEVGACGGPPDAGGSQNRSKQACEIVVRKKSKRRERESMKGEDRGLCGTFGTHLTPSKSEFRFLYGSRPSSIKADSWKLQRHPLARSDRSGKIRPPSDHSNGF